MTTVWDVLQLLDQKSPVSGKMDFDNVGLLVGRSSAEVKRVLVSLDITEDVVEEAALYHAELIVSHHPIFFELRSVTDSTGSGQKVLALAENHIAAICMHTNLDAAEGGVNDVLMSVLGGTVTGILDPKTHIGRVGKLPQPMNFQDFLIRTKAVLSSSGLRYHDAGRSVEHIAVCGGSGGGDIPLASAAGCDTYVTADVKYDQFLEAKRLGINLIDGDHFCTENVVVAVLKDWICKAFPGIAVEISRIHRQTAQFF